MQQLSLQSMDGYFEKLLRTIPEERKALFARLEPQLEAVVRGVVGGGGKVASWQIGALGDYGGFAAVHPAPKTDWEGYAVGRITNAITSGHHAAKTGKWVSGKHYYESAYSKAKDILQQEIAKMENQIKGGMAE